MNKVILIGGELATGKTTLAKSLSKKTGIPFFYKDVIKEILADQIGFANRDENKNLSKTQFEIFFNISEQFIDAKKDLILESNFKQEEVDRLNELFTNAGYKIISIVLDGDDDILYKRYLNRFANENRHPAHANFGNKDEFNDYNKNLLKVNYPGEVHKHTTNTFILIENIDYIY